MVLSGLVTAWRLASWPTIRSPLLGFTATIDGVRRLPSAFSSTVGSPASITATTEFVVPRSIPSTFAIVINPSHGRTAAHQLSYLGRGPPRHRSRLRPETALQPRVVMQAPCRLVRGANRFAYFVLCTGYSHPRKKGVKERLAFRMKVAAAR